MCILYMRACPGGTAMMMLLLRRSTFIFLYIGHRFFFAEAMQPMRYFLFFCRMRCRASGEYAGCRCRLRCPSFVPLHSSFVRASSPPRQSPYVFFLSTAERTFKRSKTRRRPSARAPRNRTLEGHCYAGKPRLLLR